MVNWKWEKIFWSLPLGGILPVFLKHCQIQPCTFTASVGTEYLTPQHISNLQLALLSCCSRKSWRWTCSPWQNILSTAACSFFTGSLVVFLPQPSPCHPFPLSHPRSSISRNTLEDHTGLQANADLCLWDFFFPFVSRLWFKEQLFITAEVLI